MREPESALAAYAFHDLKTMASTSAVIALARVALAAVRGNQRDMAEAITQQQTIDPEIGIILPWYRPLSGAILAMASVRAATDGYREYVSWCDDSQAPEAGMCTLLAARARQGILLSQPLAELSPAERRVGPAHGTHDSGRDRPDPVPVPRDGEEPHGIHLPQTQRAIPPPGTRSGRNLALTGPAARCTTTHMIWFHPQKVIPSRPSSTIV